jgi:hypothetical protein
MFEYMDTKQDIVKGPVAYWSNMWKILKFLKSTENKKKPNRNFEIQKNQ